MQKETITKAVSTGASLLNVGVKTIQAREAINEKIEEGKWAAKRMVRNNRRLAEDLIYDAETHIRKNPLQSVLISLSAGFVLGATLSLLFRGNKKSQ